jgi:hypothetical protein
MAVLHIDEKSNGAVILDITGRFNDRQSLGLLLCELILFCKRKGITIITTSLLNKRIEKVLSKCGFSKQKSGYRLMSYTQDKKLKQKLLNADSWHFIIGDTDRY